MIEKLARAAVNRLKAEYKLPTEGFLAGGSLANTIWELRTGKKAIINDIDIFKLSNIVNLSEGQIKREKHSKFTFTKAEVDFVNNPRYGHVLYQNKFDVYYRINSADRSDLLNLISYESNSNKYDIIIESFDLNCTQIGYDLAEDRFIWSPHFEEFIETGELKVVNANTPAHTSIRLIKKSKDLQVEYDKSEFDLLALSLLHRQNLIDVVRVKFADKYFEMYKEVRDDIGVGGFIEISDDKSDPGFGVMLDNRSTLYIKRTKGEDVKVYEIYLNYKYESYIKEKYKGTYNLKTLNDLNSYFRNISSDPKKVELYEKIAKLYSLDNKEYIDCDYTDSDIDMLTRVQQYAPVALARLKGLKLSEQISIVRKIITKYKDDPTLAGSVLEKVKFDPNKELDDDDLLLIELMVRKEEITNKNLSRFKNLIEDSPTQSSTEVNDDFEVADIKLI